MASFEQLELDAMTGSEVVDMLFYDVERLVRTFHLLPEVAEDAPTSIRHVNKSHMISEKTIGFSRRYGLSTET
jgi:predicted AAA+ superfamily ATPase